MPKPLETDKKTAGALLNALGLIAYKAVKKDGEFVLPGFGKLVKQKRPARMAFNPQTRQKVKVAAKKRWSSSAWPKGPRTRSSGPRRCQAQGRRGSKRPRRPAGRGRRRGVAAGRFRNQGGGKPKTDGLKLRDGLRKATRCSPRFLRADLYDHGQPHEPSLAYHGLYAAWKRAIPTPRSSASNERG